MARTIAYLAITCSLLAVLAVLVLKKSDTAGDSGPDAAALEPTTELPGSQWTEPVLSPNADESQPQLTRTEPNILAVIEGESHPDVESPPWAEEMESIILAYIARHPLKLTTLQVQCVDTECVIFMGGENVPVYQMDFDVFAEEHGFADAVIRGSDGSDRRIVRLRR